jgi:hypothetical protein
MACLYQTAATDAIRQRQDVGITERAFEEQLAAGRKLKNRGQQAAIAHR